jgi:hypothetical protein
MSAHQAVLFAKEVGFSAVLFEGDALQVIQALSASPPHLHSIWHLVPTHHHPLLPSRAFTFPTKKKKKKKKKNSHILAC